MGEKFLSWIEQIATGSKKGIFWAVMIVVLLAAYVFFPYIDAHFLVYNRIEQRIDNLGKLVDISGGSVESNDSLAAEYKSILGEMDKARETLEDGKVGTGDSRDVTVKKFIGGALLGVLVAVMGLFSPNPEGRMTLPYFLMNNIPACGFGILLALGLGYLSTFIPTLWSVWVNVILSPVIQSAILILISSSSEQPDDAQVDNYTDDIFYED